MGPLVFDWNFGLVLGGENPGKFGFQVFIGVVNVPTKPIDSSWDGISIHSALTSLSISRRKSPKGEQCFLHQTFQVPKMEVLTYISCMDTAYGYGKTHAQNSRK